MATSPIVMLYDCDTNKGSNDENNIHIRTMQSNAQNSTYRKGVENLLNLPNNFNKNDFYSISEKTDEYSAISTIKSLDKMNLCNYICSLGEAELKLILENINSEIQKILLI